VGFSFVYERGATVASATAYTRRGDRVLPAARNTENYVDGDGQVSSTVADLAKWAGALSSNTLVTAGTLKEAVAPAEEL